MLAYCANLPLFGPLTYLIDLLLTGTVINVHALVVSLRLGGCFALSFALNSSGYILLDRKSVLVSHLELGSSVDACFGLVVQELGKEWIVLKENLRSRAARELSVCGTRFWPDLGAIRFLHVTLNSISENGTLAKMNFLDQDTL
jgi:hypothetical protein